MAKKLNSRKVPDLARRSREILRGRPLLWDTITTTGWSGLSRAAGFLLPFFLAAWFGATGATDAFFFAYGLILFLAGIFAPTVETVIVPYLAGVRGRREEAGNLVGGIMWASGAAFIHLAGLLIVLVRPLLRLLTQFDPATLDLIHLLLIESAPLVVLLTWSSVLAGTLNASQRFAVPAVSPLLRTAVNLGIIFLGKNSLGVHAVPLGYLGGESARLLLLLGAIWRLDLFRIRFRPGLSPRLKRFFKTTSFLSIGMAATGLYPVVDKVMASWLGAGSISLLYYADRLYLIPVALVTAGVFVTLLSHWSRRYGVGGAAGLRKDVRSALVKLGVLSFLIAAPAFFLARPLSRLAYGRGNFPPKDIAEVALIFSFYILGFVPFILSQVFVRAHLTLKNTKILMYGAFLKVALKIVLNYVFIGAFNIAGIALAHSVVSVVSLLYAGIFFYRRIKEARGSDEL